MPAIISIVSPGSYSRDFVACDDMDSESDCRSDDVADGSPIPSLISPDGSRNTIFSPSLHRNIQTNRKFKKCEDDLSCSSLSQNTSPGILRQKTARHKRTMRNFSKSASPSSNTKDIFLTPTVDKAFVVSTSLSKSAANESLWENVNLADQQKTTQEDRKRQAISEKKTKYKLPSKFSVNGEPEKRIKVIIKKYKVINITYF